MTARVLGAGQDSNLRPPDSMPGATPTELPAPTSALPSYGEVIIPCQHHWDIETTPGKFSPGVCRLCGEVKADFRNGFAHDYEEYNEARKLVRTTPKSEPTSVNGPVRTKSNRMSRYE